MYSPAHHPRGTFFVSDRGLKRLLSVYTICQKVSGEDWLMKSIVICGDSGDGILTHTIISACEHYGGVLTADGGMIRPKGKEPDFLVRNVDTLSAVDGKGILVLGERLCPVPPDVQIGNVITIVDSNNQGALHLLKRTGKTVIGCSMSDRDTMTLSERNESGCLVCVRRTLTTWDGQTIEPCEIPVSVGEEIPVFAVLAACGVLLLCDIPCEEGYIMD